METIRRILHWRIWTLSGLVTYMSDVSACGTALKELRSETLALKECGGDLTLENRLLKKSMTGAGEFEE